jgi:hypothetical protein
MIGLVTSSHMSLHQPLVVIGPLAVGKSTVSAAVAALLDLPIYSIDAVRWGYFAEIGYDQGQADRTFASGATPTEKMAYVKPFEVYGIEQVMATTPVAVVDFGASNSVYDDAVLLARVERALTNAFVVLLLPSPDPQVSEQLLAARLDAIVQAKGESLTDELLSLNSYFVRHQSNHQLADAVVYTGTRSPESVAAEVVALYEP